MKPPRCALLARILLLSFASIAGNAAHAQSIYTPYAFTNFVGQPGAIGSADGAGTAAGFNIPHSLAVDSSGNVYVADTFNHSIRKITPAGVSTTIAGSPGNKGYGDGVGNAEAPRFNSPIGLSSDSAGNIYVADNGNQSIRKVTPTGVVSLFAGQIGIKGSQSGPRIGATFNSPNSTAVDSAGNIYVSDLVNRVIRKIEPDGIVGIFAGTVGLQGTNDGVGSIARFTAPMGLAVDRANNLYVADQGGDTIRKIAPGGTVTTLAGTGKKSGSTDGVGADARFTGPENLAVDSAGNVYVSDTGNQTIRKVTPDGVVTTLAGSPGLKGTADGTNDVARFSTPRGIVVDRSNIVFVADSGNSAIRKLVVTGGDRVVTTFAGTLSQNGSVDATGNAAQFHFPYGLAFDPDGNLYAADRSNQDIRKITPDGIVTTFAGLPGEAGSADGSGGGAQFYGPEELKVDSSGNIYVVEFFNNTVRKIAPVGANWVVTTLAGCPTCPAGTNDGPGIEARFSGPFGLTVDSSGNVFVADTGNQTIRKLTPSGDAWTVTTFAGAPKVGGASDGVGTAARFGSPIGLAADRHGNIFVVDGFSVRMITSDATVTTLAGHPGIGSADGDGSVATFWVPRGIAVDAAGNLFVADTANHLIRELASTGGAWNVTTLAGSPGMTGTNDGAGSEARFNQPSGITVDALGNLYVVDSNNHRITKGISPDGGMGISVGFDSGGGGLSVAEGSFSMRVTGPMTGSVVLEASTDLVLWLPIQTNSLSAPPVTLSVPIERGADSFFRLRLTP